MVIALELAFLGLAAAALSGALARIARRAHERRSGLGTRARGEWPITIAVLRGRGRGARELRFLAFVGGVVTVVTGALLFPNVPRAIGPLGVLPVVAAVVPALVLALSAGADLLCRAAKLRAGAARAADAAPSALALAGPPAELAPVRGSPAISFISAISPTATPAESPAESPAQSPAQSPTETPAASDPDETVVIARPQASPEVELDAHLGAARTDVQEALERVSDPSLHRAAVALEELLGECAARLSDPARSASLRARIDGVATLARAIADDELQDARALLGVTASASADEVARVHAALDAIYRGEAALPGVDPARADALAAAAARLLPARPTLAILARRAA